MIFKFYKITPTIKKLRLEYYNGRSLTGAKIAITSAETGEYMFVGKMLWFNFWFYGVSLIWGKKKGRLEGEELRVFRERKSWGAE